MCTGIDYKWISIIPYGRNPQFEVEILKAHCYGLTERLSTQTCRLFCKYHLKSTISTLDGMGGLEKGLCGIKFWCFHYDKKNAVVQTSGDFIPISPTCVFDMFIAEKLFITDCFPNSCNKVLVRLLKQG